MSFKHMKNLFLVAFLGLALVGCSSTPENKEAGMEQAASGMSDAEMEAAKRAAAEAAELAAKKSALYSEIEGKVVYFDFDRSDVKSEYYSTVKGNADYMSIDSSMNVTINGYCDERGSREYNLALGERRANSVKDSMVSEGVSADRINVVSFGEDNPAVEGSNEAAWAKNRRAEFAY